MSYTITNMTEPDWLAGRKWRWQDYSQFNEDGLIAAALDYYGVVHSWCFEVGAGDGHYLSNTKRLREQGWHALLIEKEPTAYEKLAAYAGDRVHTRLLEADGASLTAALIEVGAPVNLDLGIIDIDGNDYWMWHDLVEFRPRLMLVEFGLGTDPDHLPDPDEGRTGSQAGFHRILELGATKGYAPVMNTACNVLFARQELKGRPNAGRL